MEKLKFWEKNLSQVHSVPNKTNVNWRSIEPNSPQAANGNWPSIEPNPTQAANGN
jgi:hypothetical protein